MDWLAVPAAILLLTLGLCLLLAVPLVKRQGQKEIRSPAEFNLFYEDVSFLTADHLQLHGWWIPSPASTRTVILLHGYAGSMDPDIRYAPSLHKAGFNVLMFDFRAHARSSGRLTSVGALESRDVHAAINLARAKGSQSIGLLGFSMGGRAAVLAAPYPPVVKAVISDGAPARLVTAITQDLLLRKIPPALGWLLARMILVGASVLTGVNLSRNDLHRAAANLPGTPVLFIHGGLDRYTTSEELNKLMQLAGTRARFWSVPEAKHRNIEDTRPDEYLEQVLSFLKENL